MFHAAEQQRSCSCWDLLFLSDSSLHVVQGQGAECGALSSHLDGTEHDNCVCLNAPEHSSFLRKHRQGNHKTVFNNITSNNVVIM